MDDRGLGFQRKERIAFFSHNLLHIRPRCIHTFGGDVLTLIQKGIQDTQPQMTHRHFVHIRKTICNSQLNIIMIFDYAVPFTAYIAGRLTDLTE